MRARLITALTVVAAAAGLGACGGAAASASAPVTATASPQSAAVQTEVAAVHSVTTVAFTPAAVKLPLSGKKIGVDPGHNGDNFTDPGYIDRQVWNGREYENCNTTGTETDGGYTEARFNWNVAQYLVADLKREGAQVVLTRHSNTGVGPCVTRRAAIMNDAHVNVAVAIHGDGAPASGHGFAILTPVADGINNRVIGSSNRFARDLRTAFRAHTGMPVSTYDGVDGLQPRDNLAGENLTKVPYALIECGNMRNAGDAALETSPAWQKRAAAGIAAAITKFLT